MKKIILALACISVLSACNNSSDNKNSPAPVNPTNAPEVIKTDYTMCDQGTAPVSLEGQWKRDASYGEIAMSLVMNVRNNTVQMSNICTSQGRALKVTASTSLRYDNSTIEFLGSDKASDEINEHNPDFHLSCNIELSPKQVNYRFQGQCLVLSSPDQPEEFIMVPVR